MIPQQAENMLNHLRTLWRHLPLPARFRRFVGPLVRDAIGLVKNLCTRLVPPRAPIEQIKKGKIIVAGFTQSALGMGMAARLYTSGLKKSGFEVEAINIPTNAFTLGEEKSAPPLHTQEGGILIVCVNPPQLRETFNYLGNAITAAPYRIAAWAWELPAIPNSWVPYIKHFHEIWAPSHFVADAIRARMPEDCGTIIRMVPYPFPSFTHMMPDRAAFALPATICVVLMMFDLRSILERKNPFAAIDAFKKTNAENALLLIKVSHPDTAPDLFRRLQQTVAGHATIRLMTEMLPDQGIYQLISSCDIILSLHRAEGLGLVMAEAMCMGKAVIATGWSSNTDYMTNDCAAMVNYTMVEATDSLGVYHGQKWADADSDHAAALLKNLIENPDQRHAMGKKARIYANTHFSHAHFVENLDENFRRYASHNGSL
jgi:hypothetical protein